MTRLQSLFTIIDGDSRRMVYESSDVLVLIMWMIELLLCVTRQGCYDLPPEARRHGGHGACVCVVFCFGGWEIRFSKLKDTTNSYAMAF